ncbi:hypothetical protein NMY22_g19312 [Coprinellus aureogranulatus]|nr:hypothetical protein NMY22_g19312 [Coprinellus aureogranulatus]
MRSSYDAAEDNEITFHEGELITEIEPASEDWWQGKNPRGEVGLFPANYVEVQDFEMGSRWARMEESYEQSQTEEDPRCRRIDSQTSPNAWRLIFGLPGQDFVVRLNRIALMG